MLVFLLSGRGNYFLLYSYRLLCEGWEPGHVGDKDLMHTYEKRRCKPLSSVLPWATSHYMMVRYSGE